MNMEAIKLRFNSPVHLGVGKDNLDKSELVYHSDSLKSALYAVGHRYFDWSNENEFFNGFAISSCFPFAGKEYFLPKPMLYNKIEFLGNKDDSKAAKKVKKISWFSKKHFLAFINPKTNQITIDENWITPDGAFVCEHVATASNLFYQAEVQQRVSIPKIDSEEKDAKPFYADRVFFNKDCGLYFLVEFNNEQLRTEILHTLKLLGDLGIGTDRTVGNGLFDFDAAKDVEPFELPKTQFLNLYVNLGLYLPTEAEHQHINYDDSSWGFTKRAGYIAGSADEAHYSLRKNSIYMFNEGSVFCSPAPLIGKYENLKPNVELNADQPALEHPIWRDGQCLFITI